MTDFPYADTTRLVVKGSGQFDIKVRVPRWATRGFFVKINGRDQTVKAVPGSYLTLARTWRANDTIELRMPFRFYLDHVMDQPNVASIFYGPVLLAAEEAGPRTDWRQVTLDATRHRQVDHRRSGDAAVQHRRRGVQAVLRNLRAALGLPARDVEVAPDDR